MLTTTKMNDSFMVDVYLAEMRCERLTREILDATDNNVRKVLRFHLRVATREATMWTLALLKNPYVTAVLKDHRWLKNQVMLAKLCRKEPGDPVYMAHIRRIERFIKRDAAEMDRLVAYASNFKLPKVFGGSDAATRRSRDIIEEMLWRTQYKEPPSEEEVRAPHPQKTITLEINLDAIRPRKKW